MFFYLSPVLQLSPGIAQCASRPRTLPLRWWKSLPERPLSTPSSLRPIRRREHWNSLGRVLFDPHDGSCRTTRYGENYDAWIQRIRLQPFDLLPSKDGPHNGGRGNQGHHSVRTLEAAPPVTRTETELVSCNSSSVTTDHSAYPPRRASDKDLSFDEKDTLEGDSMSLPPNGIDLLAALERSPESSSTSRHHDHMV